MGKVFAGKGVSEHAGGDMKAGANIIISQLICACGVGKGPADIVAGTAVESGANTFLFVSNEMVETNMAMMGRAGKRRPIKAGLCAREEWLFEIEKNNLNSTVIYPRPGVVGGSNMK